MQPGFSFHNFYYEKKMFMFWLSITIVPSCVLGKDRLTNSYLCATLFRFYKLLSVFVLLSLRTFHFLFPPCRIYLI